MKNFKCTVERTEEYIIEFDENVINEEFLKEFSRWFFQCEDLEELSEHIAQFRARFGERFIEGIGRPLENGRKPSFADERELNKAINVKVVSEDNNCYVDVEEIEN
jgi:hypothetical protein